MRQRKHERSAKRQRGQFLTPPELASKLIESIDLSNVERVLEPSCGDGSFINALLRHRSLLSRERSKSLDPWSITGIEIDADLAAAASAVATAECPSEHVHVDILCADFFELYLRRQRVGDPSGTAGVLSRPFDLIIGNPPFGGTFDHALEDELDRRLGKRFGRKIKKETYAFFIIACTELLKQGGQLFFICSDSLVTIPTMTGLRHYLMQTGSVSLHELAEFSSETNYPMLVIEYRRGAMMPAVSRFGERLDVADIERTPNLSWGLPLDLARLFRGPQLSDLFVATSGMTTGKNEFFVREIDDTGSIEEPFEFQFYEAPVTVEYERERARLHRLPARRLRQLQEAEAGGETQRRVRVERRAIPQTIRLPDSDYRPYNKANGRLLYSDPTHVIYWRDEGDAVLTYKATGNWYLRGVGGQPFFGREGLTWPLVASRFAPRYLPAGYILDSGAPCAFPKSGVPVDEVYFVIGWLLTRLANRVLKTTINHTMNIQSKDFERMPYPWWVEEADKHRAIGAVRAMIKEAEAGREWGESDPEVRSLDAIFDSGLDSINLPPRNQDRKTAAPCLFESLETS